jgi:hypothetical protein
LKWKHRSEKAERPYPIARLSAKNEKKMAAAASAATIPLKFVTPFRLADWESRAKSLYPRTYKSYQETGRLETFAKDMSKKYPKAYETCILQQRAKDWNRYAEKTYTSEYDAFLARNTYSGPEGKACAQIDFGKEAAKTHREDYCEFTRVWKVRQEELWDARQKELREARIEREVAKRLEEIAFDEEVERRVAARLAAKGGAGAGAGAGADAKESEDITSSS